MIQLLDCTIRDGSYVINGEWTKDDIRNIAGGLAKGGFPYIEVGNGIGLGANRKNVNSICTDTEYVTTATEVKGNSKIGVFFIPGVGNFDDIKLFKENGGNFIRIGTNVSDSDEAKKYIEYARNMGIEVAYNFMKSYVVSPYELCLRAIRIEEYGAECISLVDSAGGMLPEQVSSYISKLKDCVNIKVGFHGHNNLLLANANSLAAVQQGADIIDCTLMGMGRGSGNAQTESMLVILEKAGFPTKIDPFEVSKISEKYIAPKASKLKGSDAMELVLGYALFHDSYLSLVEKHAAKNKVDAQRLIIEVGKINKENPSEELIANCAEQLRKKNKVVVHYPRFYHKQIK